MKLHLIDLNGSQKRRMEVERVVFLAKKVLPIKSDAFDFEPSSRVA
jgi:hypothetical protein